MGLSRGPGAAELLWGQESPGREQDFRAEALPPARVLDLERSGLAGLGAAPPELDAERGSAGSADVEGSLGGAAWSRRLAPRHREAVERWFAPAVPRDGQ